jgi:hypothetical protein
MDLLYSCGKSYGRTSVKLLIEELRATEDPLRQFSLVAQIIRQAYEPLVSSLELLRTAGAVAPELADLACQIEARRCQNQARLIAYLQEHTLLRPGLSFEEATDVLWALTSYDVYRMLVVEQRWEPARYETWLAQLLIYNLLQPTEG